MQLLTSVLMLLASVVGSFFLSACQSSLPQTYVSQSTIAPQPQVDSIPPKVDFEETKRKYSNLIPVMNGWFITSDSADAEVLLKLQQAEKSTPPFDNKLDSMRYENDFASLIRLGGLKWGVIDSAGNTIVPFICDAVRQSGTESLQYTVYRFSYSLNTGIPRYKYYGTLYTIDRQAQQSSKPQYFEKTVVFLADFHRPEFVIQEGPAFFFP